MEEEGKEERRRTKKIRTEKIETSIRGSNKRNRKIKLCKTRGDTSY
jgi:hypothetical protein